MRVSNVEKNIHSKNHAFETPIVLTLERYARVCINSSELLLKTSIWLEREHHFQKKRAYGVRVSNVEKNIHSKNHDFETPIVLTLTRYASFCEPFSKNTKVRALKFKNNLEQP